MTIKTIAKIKAFIDNFFQDLTWIYVLLASLFVFIVATNFFEYIVGIIVLIFSVIIIYHLYFSNQHLLRHQVEKKLMQLDFNCIVLPSVEISFNNQKSFSDYIVISPKGIFNIMVLDFSGTLIGLEEHNTWQLIDNSNPYDVVKIPIQNPLISLKKSQQLIEKTLEQNYLKYLFIRSILVVHNNTEIKVDTDIPIVKAKHLVKHISNYSDRPVMDSLRDLIQTALINGTHEKCPIGT